jgi:hypothetical protein
MLNQNEREALHSVPEAAKLSGIPVRTLYRAIQKDYLTTTRISGIPFLTLDNIEAWKAGPFYMPRRKPYTRR